MYGLNKWFVVFCSTLFGDNPCFHHEVFEFLVTGLHMILDLYIDKYTMITSCKPDHMMLLSVVTFAFCLQSNVCINVS